ncbi:MAG: tyrosine-type recombinase/integrase [Rhodobacteraceae bacterium]|nr:tyrosine-type recombinase/integrase [Paracoccaceae bacterium]
MTGKKYVFRVPRAGKDYWYFRRGRTYVRLPDDPNSEEFDRKYWEIRSGRAPITSRTTWERLVLEYYASAKFKKLRPGSRANYRRHCEAIVEKNGKKDVRKFRRRDALAVQSALQDTWSKANERIAVMSILCKLAVNLEWITTNPVENIEKLTGGEYEPWPQAKLTAYENYCAREELTAERTIFELCTGTGQRIGDVVKMEWSDFDGEYIQVKQEKTGADLWIFCPRRLREYLASLPRHGKHILAKNLTQHLSKRRAQALVMAVRTAIEAKGYVIHGWRYNAATELAEAGCSDSQIAAVTGHKTLAMVQKYRSKARQKMLSKKAQERRQ